MPRASVSDDPFEIALGQSLSSLLSEQAGLQNVQPMPFETPDVPRGYNVPKNPFDTDGLRSGAGGAGDAQHQSADQYAAGAYGGASAGYGQSPYRTGGSYAAGTGGSGVRSSLTAAGWAAYDPVWQRLDGTSRAAAMSLMEADGMKAEDALNVASAIVNRAAKERQPLGNHVSRAIYQPTIEPAQQRRLSAILSSPQFQQVRQFVQDRLENKVPDRVNGATHFLAPESTMLRLEAGNPSKYRSWRAWTGYDSGTGSYRGVITRDGSHAFLAPEGAYSHVPKDSSSTALSGGVTEAREYLRANAVGGAAGQGGSGSIMRRYGYDPIDSLNGEAAVKFADAIRSYNETAASKGLPPAKITSATRFPLPGMPGGFANRERSNHAGGLAMDITFTGGLDNDGPHVREFASHAKAAGLYWGRDIYGAHEGHHWQATSARQNPHVGNYDREGRPIDIERITGPEPQERDVSPDKPEPVRVAESGGVPESRPADIPPDGPRNTSTKRVPFEAPPPVQENAPAQEVAREAAPVVPTPAPMQEATPVVTFESPVAQGAVQAAVPVVPFKPVESAVQQPVEPVVQQPVEPVEPAPMPFTAPRIEMAPVRQVLFDQSARPYVQPPGQPFEQPNTGQPFEQPVQQPFEQPQPPQQDTGQPFEQQTQQDAEIEQQTQQTRQDTGQDAQQDAEQAAEDEDQKRKDAEQDAEQDAEEGF